MDKCAGTRVTLAGHLGLFINVRQFRININIIHSVFSQYFYDRIADGVKLFVDLYRRSAAPSEYHTRSGDRNYLAL